MARRSDMGKQGSAATDNGNGHGSVDSKQHQTVVNPLSWTSLAIGLLSAGVALAVYSNDLHGDFVFDDLPAIKNNPDVDSSKTPLSNLLTNNFWGQGMAAFDTQHQSYRPLTVLTFRLNHDAHGLEPYGFHVVNNALHALASLLFGLVASQVLVTQELALAASMLFATHPVHAEAVAGLVGRAEVLSGVFFLACLLATLHIIQADRVPSAKSAVLASALTALAVLSKEQGLTALPCAAAAVLLFTARLTPADLVPSLIASMTSSSRSSGGTGKKRKAAKRGTDSQMQTLPASVSGAWKHTLLLAAGAIIILVLRLRINQQEIEVDEKTNPANHIENFLYRALTKMLYCTLHGWLLIFPKTLCSDWAGGSIPVVSSLADPRNAGTAALFLGLVALVLWMWRTWTPSNARILFAAAITIVSFLPASGLFMEVGFVLAERVLYLPSIGFCLLLAALAERLCQQRPALKHVAAAMLIIIASLYAARTYQRNFDWASEKSLFVADVNAAPLNAKLHHNAAYHLQGEEKEFHYREAIRLYPHYVSAYLNLGAYLAGAGRVDEALEAYQEGLKRHQERPLYSTDVGMFYRNMASAYLRKGQPATARTYYQRCLKVSPGHPYCTSMVQQLQGSEDTPTDTFDTTVRHLDESTFSSTRRTFIMFYAPWCQHCKDAKKDYKQLAKEAANLGLPAIEAVDCTKMTQLCQTNNISGYPTFRLYKGDGGFIDYEGSRTATDMKAFLQQHSS